MKLPSITNSTLLSVHAAGFSDDYGQAATQGAEKWSGEEDVYFREQAERIQTGGASDVIVGRSVVVSDDLDIEFSIGDRLTLQDVADVLTVRRIARTVAPGLAGVVRLVVEDG